MRAVYSDGIIEDSILDSIEDVKKMEELIRIPGATFHNFTNCRENLINWYPFDENSRVLEIGAGMGALTGVLCEKCKHVTAIEQSEKRAEIIRKRYKKYTNLDVISSDIFECKFEYKFDYVLLIGVLEYVGINSKLENPYKNLLSKINEILNENGKLLLAIENRFGLKYWCGAAEDHTSVPFDGINGYKDNISTGRYGKSGVRTFSKSGLEELLLKSGFSSNRFYYPLPDYKFPTAIFSDEKTPTMVDIRGIKFTYPMESELIADERELYEEVIKNNRFDFFANSYFIECSKNGNDDDILAVYFKRDYKLEYNICTIVKNDRVSKVPLNEQALQHLTKTNNIQNKLRDRQILVVESSFDNGVLQMPFLNNMSAFEYVNDALDEGRVNDIFRLLDDLKANIYKSSDITDNNAITKRFPEYEDVLAGTILKNAYIDMTFINSFVAKEGQLLFFDQEWELNDIPVSFILYRSINSLQPKTSKGKKIKEKLFEYVGVNGKLKEVYILFEQSLLNDMMNDINCAVFDSSMYHEGLRAVSNSRQKLLELETTKREYAEFKEQAEFSIEEKESQIKERESQIQDRDAQIKDKDAQIQDREEKITEKEEQLQYKEQIIRNKEGHIEQLLKVERDFENVKKSKFGRLMYGWWGLKEKMMPQGSKRRLVAKIIKQFIKHPVYMLKKCTPSRIARTVKYIKTETPESVENRLALATMNAGVAVECVELDLLPLSEFSNIKQVDKLIIPDFEKILVSIIIPVYNQFEYTYNCVKSIIKNTNNIEYEIIIADDCSTDLTVSIQEIVQNVRVIKTVKNVRFLKNCNNAAKYAKGDYIVFLNNDTQVLPNWLAPLVRLIESNKNIGMVGSKLLYPDGSLQEAGGIIWGDGHAWNYGNGQSPNKPEFNYVKEADYISGASIMITKALWNEIGGFDELFCPAYCEDSDLAFEVRKRGYRVMFQPQSMVVHFEGKSNGTDLSSGVKKYQVENQIKLKEKWKHEFEKQVQTEDQLFYAKDRSKGKKTILFIDHYIPQIDKDAGSKTTWQYLQMFVAKGYNVKFMGDNFYQDTEYAHYLEQLGIEVLYGPWYANNYKKWIIENQQFIDFAYLNRPHITEKYIDFIKNETNIKCIYYGHDLHYLRIMREYELLNDERLLCESERWKEKELNIMRKAEMNYYPSYVEIDEIHKIDKNIPAKAITAYVYDDFRNDISTDFATRNGILFVGGFGHPPNEDAVLWFANNVYPMIREKMDVNFYIVGAKVTDKVKKLAGNGIIVKGFVSEEELKQLYDVCKMVVVPLRYGAGVKGKVVEAMYNGIPIVSTSVGTEGLFKVEEFIKVADEEVAFARAVIELYNDNKKLAEMSEKSQKYISEHNGIEAVWDNIKDDFM